MTQGIRLLVVATALALPTGLSAQIYKWVDEHGVTNYSNHRPAAGTDAGPVAIVKDRVSVYSPDKGLAQAVDDFRMRSNATAVNRSLPSVPAQQYSTPVYLPAPAIPDPCAAYRTAHCNEFYAGYYPDAPGFGHHGHTRWRKRLPQVRIPPGTIAGQVVGASGFIPGNSANARQSGRPAFQRAFRPAFEPRSTGGRALHHPSRLR